MTTTREIGRTLFFGGQLQDLWITERPGTIVRMMLVRDDLVVDDETRRTLTRLMAGYQSSGSWAKVNEVLAPKLPEPFSNALRHLASREAKDKAKKA